MFNRPKSPKDVWRLTLGGSLCSVIVTVVLVPFAFVLTDPLISMIKAALIASLCAIPTCWVLFNEMSKNETLAIRLRELVNRDRLTDVATRDYFFTRMEAAPSSFGVSLMVDIDHFKTVNDTYGHLTGDLVIQRVAEVLQHNVRDDDIVCRFGGEEFIIFLAEYDPDEGAETAERIRKAIEKDVIQSQDAKISVTVSIGGSLKDRITDITKSIQEADDALYAAKAGGRNQTVFARARPKQAGLSSA